MPDLNDVLEENGRYRLLIPNALLIAKSVPVPGVIPALYALNDGAERERFENTDSAQPVIEFAGRVCYHAFSCKSAKTDSAEGYIRNILDQKHFSVLEHSSFTFYLTGISRADSHEIVRHRHFSFSQKSQRYVLEKTPYEISVHPAIYEAHAGDELDFFADEISQGFDEAKDTYDNLRVLGLTHKEASEAARQYIPNAAAVDMVVTGNARSWLEFISKRHHEAADRSLNYLAFQIWDILRKELPEVFSYEARQIWDEQFAQGRPKEN